MTTELWILVGIIILAVLLREVGQYLRERNYSAGQYAVANLAEKAVRAVYAQYPTAAVETVVSTATLWVKKALPAASTPLIELQIAAALHDLMNPERATTMQTTIPQ